jgi:hypothetical protein
VVGCTDGVAAVAGVVVDVELVDGVVVDVELVDESSAPVDVLACDPPAVLVAVELAAVRLATDVVVTCVAAR